MKKIKIGLLILLFAIVANAQSADKENIELQKLEERISTIEKTRNEKANELRETLIKYTSEHLQVLSIQASIKKFDEELAPLYFRRKELLKLRFIRNLPKTDTELLKMMVIQNERIIELLESLQKRIN